VVVSSNEGVPSRFDLFGCAMAACPLIARLVPDGRAPGRTVFFGVGGASARQRSAGAELGAVSSIWMVFFLGGALLALGPFETSLQPRFLVAAALSLLALFVAAAATRRTA
jgi:hypothetical protein